MSKKRFKLIVVVILLVLLSIQPKSPLDALKKQYINKKESVFRYSDLIKQIDINSEESLLFYYNGNGNVNCAVSDKKFGGYKIIDVSGELPKHKDKMRTGMIGSTYDSGEKWFYFGFIYDDSVEKVVWNDVEAIRFSVSNMEMFYAVGDGEFEGVKYHLYDSNGNELDPWQ